VIPAFIAFLTARSDVRIAVHSCVRVCRSRRSPGGFLGDLARRHVAYTLPCEHPGGKS
jgi:hypothetical protein